MNDAVSDACVLSDPDVVWYGQVAGKLGIEGKEYIVQDGDIMHFRFNV